MPIIFIFQIHTWRLGSYLLLVGLKGQLELQVLEAKEWVRFLGDRRAE